MQQFPEEAAQPARSQFRPKLGAESKHEASFGQEILDMHKGGLGLCSLSVGPPLPPPYREKRAQPRGIGGVTQKRE